MPKKSSKPDLATSLTAKPSGEDIACRAYELFLREGGRHGHDLDHWLEAERQILDRPAVAARSDATK